MTFLRKHLEGPPARARVAPFIIFLALTFCQAKFGEDARYWFYLIKTLVGAWMLWEMRSLVPEMRWAWSWDALVVGIAVFVAWVGLDGFYPKFSSTAVAWNPRLQYGENSAVAWMFISCRILGSTLVVPPLEETFYRSFIYRYLIKPEFWTIPLNRVCWGPLLGTAALFGFAHHEWLAGILCGLAYQWLVIRHDRLGDAMTAHAITNFLLGIWVVSRNAWHFW
jgi:CAAX prenyl protease-like protein